MSEKKVAVVILRLERKEVSGTVPAIGSAAYFAPAYAK
jgi:hypothetical protein